MGSYVTEFVYLTLKPSVRPEDRANEEGRAFLEAIGATRQQSGYVRSYWGRTIENENNVVWVIEWRDNNSSAPLSLLDSLLEKETRPISLHATLTPPLLQDKETELLTASPVTELAVLGFPHNLEPHDRSALDNDLVQFRAALLGLQQVKAPASFSMGWVERPSAVPHTGSPSGQASLVILVVGWGSKEEHEAVRETEEFGRTIKPIRERMVPATPALQMRHVRFKRDERKEEI
ncbi:hypothetical protein VTO42DRAFT_7093 [Malbranchea cinnamomea]